MSETLGLFRKYGKCIGRVEGFKLFPPIICKDGTFISAQAGENYKCYPRKNLDNFDYETVELNRNEVTEAEELLSPFLCSYDEYILDNVPVIVLDEVIRRHGGIDFDKVDLYIEQSKGGNNGRQ